MKLAPRMNPSQFIWALCFERATSAGGQFNLIFSAGFFVVNFHREFNQLVNKFTEGNSACFPKFWIHADGGEAWNRVHFVQVQLPALFLEEEVDARHSREFERAECVDG